ncbi:unnamed protein product [Ceratitis capitata]|uniref:(Mediterranean fruit fly) hypothetical protein n=1 Tax=Ceratitis capitata TaxID=7213 RepID=A0A811URL1_CERCA|nr:unnamed protein product [Ceratitis capitata]
MDGQLRFSALQQFTTAFLFDEYKYKYLFRFKSNICDLMLIQYFCVFLASWPVVLEEFDRL